MFDFENVGRIDFKKIGGKWGGGGEGWHFSTVKPESIPPMKKPEGLSFRFYGSVRVNRSKFHKGL